MQSNSNFYRFVTLLLRAGLLVALVAAGWFVYSKLPDQPADASQASNADTNLQIVVRPSAGMGTGAVDIPVELYPVDLVAVRQEYFTERRAGKRFDDFLSERMEGRRTINMRLDKQGQGLIIVSPGNWWIHARIEGEEELEWRLPVNVSGRQQTVELTSQNVYTRARSF